MLAINDLYVGYYRDLNILQGVSLQAESGKITTILGANGVGKSTMLKAVYGFLAPQPGADPPQRAGHYRRAHARAH